MATHIQCETGEAVLLVAVRCSDNILRFPNDESKWPGLSFQVNQLLPINPQLIERAQSELGPKAQGISIWQEYSAQMLEGVSPIATLYVAMYEPTPEDLADLPTSSWATLPALIRTLAKDRNRLAYLKAWQILSGGLEESTKALDVNEVARYLKSIESSENKS